MSRKINDMKYFGYWTLFIALVVSTLAAYYSIIGLTTIFAAAVIPVIIMGSALEVAKVTTAIWLHTYWKEAPLAMRSYLTLATLVLMFITSMGIFGFLSKAHIEQTARATEGVAQVDRIEREIARLNEDIVRSEETIVKVENSTSNADNELQRKIAIEEERIENLYERLESDIASVTDRLNQEIKPYEENRQRIDNDLEQIKELLGSDEIEQVQALVGVNPDGQYGPNTAAAVSSFRSESEVKRAEALSKISEARNNAAGRIAKLREQTDDAIAKSNELINRLRDQIGVVTEADSSDTDRIATARERIAAAELAKDELTQERYAIEIENRKLEVEVGPVKYIAEMIYGENAGTDLLEKAVRYVILLLVAVFDPLAIVLVLAGVMTIERFKGPKKISDYYNYDKESFNEEPVHSEFSAVKEFIDSQNNKTSDEFDDRDWMETDDWYGTSDISINTDLSEMERFDQTEEEVAPADDIVRDDPVVDAGDKVYDDNLAPGRLHKKN